MRNKKKNPNKIVEFNSTADVIYRSVTIFVLFFYCLTLLYVLFWLISSSLKYYDDYILYPLNPPSLDRIRWQNYVEMFGKLNVTRQTEKGIVSWGILAMVQNSIIWSLGCSVVNVFWNSVCGYVCAKYRSKFTRFIFAVGVFVMVTPLVGSFPSAMKLMRGLGVYDKMWFKFVQGPTTAFSGMHFLIMYGVFKDMPDSYIEAVRIDGGGHFTAMLRVMIPIAFPTIIALLTLNFVGSWNDTGTFLIWLPSYPNLSFGMYYIQANANSMQIGPNLVLAGIVMVSVPTIILYFASQKGIMTKFAVGGIKG